MRRTMKSTTVKAIALFVCIVFLGVASRAIHVLLMKESPSGDFSTHIIRSALKKCYFSILDCKETIRLNDVKPFDSSGEEIELLVFPKGLGYGEYGTNVLNKERDFFQAISMLFKANGKYLHEEYMNIESDGFLFGVDLKLSGYQIKILGDDNSYFKCSKDSRFLVTQIDWNQVVTVELKGCEKRDLTEFMQELNY